MTSAAVKILAIESSCDDTSAAVCADGKILSNILSTQLVHSEWGGVVPELASRAHLQKIVPVLAEALKQSGIDKHDLNAVAFTRGPGLIGSLLVGVSFAKSMALALNIPLIEVNHMQAHILSHFIDNHPQFPFLCLTVSGGHTQLVMVKDYLDMDVIGETVDDAAGEAFDKTAKLFGLRYPGGPLLDKLAREGDKHRFTFAQPKASGLDFSFSGLKTSVLYFLQKECKNNPQFVEQNLHDLCASVQHTIVKMLLKNLKAAVEETGVKEIALAGGVSANSELRKAFEDYGLQAGLKTHIPRFEYCTDNAAMIAITAYYKYRQHSFANQQTEPLARYHL